MIYKEITFNNFCDEFESFNRKENFTYEGKQALYDYLDDISESFEKGIELDIIALCREYKQYDDMEDLQEKYSDIESMEELENKTTVIGVDNSDSFIIANF